MKARIAAIRLSASLLGVLFLLAGSMYSWRWWTRFEAGRLLDVAKTFRPGITTQAEVDSSLEPFRRYRGSFHAQLYGWSDGANTIYTILNYPRWFFSGMPKSELTAAILPPLTGFTIQPRFEGGVLSSLQIAVGQSPKAASLHVFQVTLTEITQKMRPVDIRAPEQAFNGYSAEPGINSLNVFLDERATASERKMALAFNLHCMSSLVYCAETSQVLQPLPNP
jgi:hypothetical protein